MCQYFHQSKKFESTKTANPAPFLIMVLLGHLYIWDLEERAAVGYTDHTKSSGNKYCRFTF